MLGWINIAVSYEGWIGRRGSGKIGFGWIDIMIGAERAGRRNGCWGNSFVFRSLIGLGCWIGAASLVSTMKGLMGFGHQLRQRRHYVRMANCRLAWTWNYLIHHMTFVFGCCSFDFGRRYIGTCRHCSSCCDQVAQTRCCSYATCGLGGCYLGSTHRRQWSYGFVLRSFSNYSAWIKSL